MGQETGRRGKRKRDGVRERDEGKMILKKVVGGGG
jgi:hypothetical protein